MRVIGTLNPSITDTSPPTVPQNLNAVAQSAGSVQLSWSASSDNVGVTGYQVWRNGSPLSTTGQTGYTDGTTLPSTTYTYTVSAFDAAGNASAQSSQSQVTTPANAAPSWQSIPAQTLIVGNSFTLNLSLYSSDTDQDTLSYSIIAGTLPSGLTLSGSIIAGTPTTAGQTPTVTVRVADQFADASTTIAFTVYNQDVTAPPVPSGLVASAASSSQINVSWSASTDAAGAADEFVSGTQDYRVYRATDQSTFSLRTTVAVPSYSDTGLSASTRYDYKVSARDVRLNESAQSSAVNATTLASGVTSLPLVQANSGIFSFRGTFSMPATIKQDAGVAGAISVSEDGNSMYYGSFFDSVAKATIPANGTGSSSLQIGWLSTPGPGVEGGNQQHPSLIEHAGAVYKTRYSTYSDQSQSNWIQKGTTSLTGFGSLSGSNGRNMRLLSQGWMRIPPAWSALLGGATIATIGARLSVISNAQCGYGLALVPNLSSWSGSGACPVTPLLNYPYGLATQLEPCDSSAPGWSSYPKNANGGVDLISSANAYIAGAFIAPGSRSLLFITPHGYGTSDNGCRSGSSVHSDPNRVQVVAYDMLDIVAVFNGTKQPHEPRPYAWWEWNGGGVHWSSCVGGYPLLNWGAYCYVKNRWYMCADFFSNSMHTFDVASL